MADKAVFDIEQTIIGCLLNGIGTGGIFSQLEESEFNISLWRGIFAKLKKVWRTKGEVDISDAAGFPEEELKAAYIAQQTLASKRFEAFIEALKEKNALAKAAVVAVKLMNAQDMDELRDCADELAGISQQQPDTGYAEDIEEGMLKFASLKSKPRTYIKTGFAKMDKYTHMDAGDYVVIGARPSSGKTALGLQLAVQFAKQGKKTGFFSLETSNEKLFDRIIACEAGIHYGRIVQQNMNADEWAAFASATDRLKGLPLWRIQSSGKSAAWVRTECLRLGLEVAVIDYLGLLKAQGRDLREQITNISNDLHSFAQSSKKLVIALAQLNREGAGKEPTLTNLRESGGIEENADIVLLIHNPPSEETFRDCSLIVAKNKDGIAGVANDMVFEGRYQRFYEKETRYEGRGY